MSKLILLFILGISFLKLAYCGGGKNDFNRIKNPCTVTKNIKSPVVIRVVDDVLNEEPGVILGEKGLLYYTLIASRIQRDVVIECSSAHSPIKWTYKGAGASSSFKIVNTRWTGNDISRGATCYSSAIVISHVTDQLSGEYKCQEVNSTRAKKGPRKNSFKLFVPSTPASYPEEGSSVNVTVSKDPEKLSKTLVTLPCISKTMKGNMTLYKLAGENQTEWRPANYAKIRYDPFAGFIVPQRSIAFENTSRILKHQCKFEGADEPLLTVNLILESEEKIAPEKPIVKSSAPYLSWTTKQNPQLEFTPAEITPNVLIWQQFYTKKGFEEISKDAPMFYLGSATLWNLTARSTGQVNLLNNQNQSIHTWNYQVLDPLAEQSAGLKYEDYEYFHVFICRSSSNEVPQISFKSMEIKNLSDISAYYNVTDCPPTDDDTTGCIMLTSYLPQGEVKCIGDGVDDTIKYPPVPFEAGRPFFIERGSNLVVSLTPDTEKLRIPCLSNSESASSVFLYKKTESGFKKIWSEDDEEFGDSDIEFYPASGFLLTQSNSEEMQDLFGEYLCSSSTDPSDTSDIVTVQVKRKLGTNFKVFPREENVFGQIPIKFSWEADEVLEIVPATEETYRNLTLGREDPIDPRYGFGGKLVIMQPAKEGQVRKVKLRRKMDGLVLHTWTFQQINRNAEYKAGLHVDTREDSKGENLITIVCRSKTSKSPVIRYYQCLNEDTCELMRKCHEKDCPNPALHHDDAENSEIVEDCESEKGCRAITIRSMYLNGILNVSCVGDGVNEHRVVKDVYFKDDIVWDTEKSADGFVYLSVAQANDQNPTREVQHIGSNIEWEMGETVKFSCMAAPFLYSNGIKWAVETNKGKMIYQKDSIYDVQFSYSAAAQVASTFSLLIDRFDYARVYCFVPKAGSTDEWHNASTPIFIRSENSDEHCHETNSIHLIYIYPTPSKLNLTLNETRLDKLEYFVIPEDVKQIAVKVSGQKPFTWSFVGNGEGPTRTPLIQSDRQLLDFYDSSTYCYHSRLLINLRHKNPNDTGRYVVKYKYEASELASFYIFVPSPNVPHMLRQGSFINVTLPETNSPFYIPCLANSPEVKVNLMMNDTEIHAPFDVTRGFFITTQIDRTLPAVYTCLANQNQVDFVTVYLNLPQHVAELKYEKVNDFHVFTCKSGGNEVPSIRLTQVSSDGKSVETNTEQKTTKCGVNCVALITPTKQGVVNCSGQGIDETYRFPPILSGNQRNSDKSVGLWYDNSTSSFKCQMNSGEAPSLAAVTCRRPNECEIMKRLLNGKGDNSQAIASSCGEGCSELEVKGRELPFSPPNWFSVFLRCKGTDNMEILSQYFYDKDLMTYASIENAEKLKEIRLDITALRRQGKMVLATFRCFANRYFYSRGLQWGLEGKNGILEFPATPATQVEVQNFSAVMSSINLEIDENLHTAVYCFVPLLDSPAWANSTIKFPIQQLQVGI